MIKTIKLPNGQSQQIKQVCRDYWIPVGPSLGKSIVATDQVELLKKAPNWYNRLTSYFAAG
jgi:hypothetical protein